MVYTSQHSSKISAAVETGQMLKLVSKAILQLLLLLLLIETTLGICPRSPSTSPHIPQHSSKGTAG